MSKPLIVAIRFINKSGLSDNSYCFKTDIGDMEAGDVIVCDTASGLSIGQVEEYRTDEKSRKIATKWIVDTIDTTKHEARKALEMVSEMSEMLDKEREGYIKKIKTFKGKEIKDYSRYSESTLFHDNRVKQIEVYAPKYPYTAIFEYTQQSNEFISIPGWYPQIGYRVGVEYASFNITYNDNTPPRYKLFNISEPEQRSITPGLTTSSWLTIHGDMRRPMKFLYT